jgi:uncharacterized protein
MGQKIAIIGGGIAGLTAGYLLQRENEITLFERSGRLGGNAQTYLTQDGHALDIAVAAFGQAGYPNFYKLLKRLSIETRWCASSYMTMYNLDEGDGLYLTPFSWKGLLAQRFAMFAPQHLFSISSAYLGIKVALRELRRGRLAGLTLAQALKNMPMLQGESRRLLLCALCLMSSMSAKDVLASPAEFFFSKLSSHSDVLSPRSVYSVRCVATKTQSYVDALSEGFNDRVQFNSQIATVERGEGEVQIVDERGQRQRFDKVIFACNADQALTLLDKPTQTETDLLGKWSYNDGKVILHRDSSSFPRRELMQAYTFLYSEKSGEFDTSVSGSLWHLPGVAPDCPYISSQHPNFPIDPSLIEYETVLRTPNFTFDSYPTVKRLPTLNGKMNSYYCGSHFGHGLHEDAIRSAIDVATQLGATW